MSAVAPPNNSIAAAHLAAAASHTAAATTTASPIRAGFNPLPFLAMIFGPIVNAIGQSINVPELVRTVIAAFSTGGGVIAVITAVRANLPAIWLDPGTIGIAEYVLGAALDAFVRHKAGLPIIPRAATEPVPMPGTEPPTMV